MLSLRSWAWLTTALAVILNVYIYTYPSLASDQCDWSHRYRNLDALTPLEKKIVAIPYVGDLYLQHYVPEDPSLEPTPKDIRLLAIGDPQINDNWKSTSYAKRIDNFATDFYLGHVYSMMKPRLEPDYLAVMGDMFSSQWIGDSMFYNRTIRMMTRLFPRPDNQTIGELEFCRAQEDIDWRTHLGWFKENLYSGYFKKPDYYSYSDVHDWTSANLTNEPLILNVSGNHDIGYGDTTYQHMARWRRVFGKDNFWINYDDDTDHPWRIVMLNSLALDGPLLQPEFLTYDWQFVQAVADTNYTGQTILLTHIPMYKPEGLCVDGPLVDYFNENNCPPGANCHVGIIKSENHLQYNTSQKVLNAVFKNSGGIILTGHDHEGCVNYYNEDNGVWSASKNISSPHHIQELTVRSIMGDFGGNSGLVTGHFNGNEWDFDYCLCRFTTLPVWWAAKLSIPFTILVHTVAYFVTL